MSKETKKKGIRELLTRDETPLRSVSPRKKGDAVDIVDHRQGEQKQTNPPPAELRCCLLVGHVFFRSSPTITMRDREAKPDCTLYYVTI
ncbi:MAG: hypothetical protein ABR866_01265 [Candidatus Korobacteraceae bacterium]|jgi:hypothetical protein